MSKKVNLDNYVNQKLENQEFAFSDAYWEKAEQLLDAEQKKKGLWLLFNRRALIASGVLLVFMGSMGWWFLRNASDSSQTAVTHEEPKTVVSDAKQTPEKITSTNSTNSTNPENTSNQNNQSGIDVAQQPKPAQNFTSQEPDIAVSKASNENSSKVPDEVVDDDLSKILSSLPKNPKPSGLNDTGKPNGKEPIMPEDKLPTPQPPKGEEPDSTVNEPELLIAAAEDEEIELPEKEEQDEKQDGEQKEQFLRKEVAIVFGGHAYQTLAGNQFATQRYQLSPYAGILVDLPVSTHIGLRLQPGYSYREGINSTASSTQTTYGFGVNTSSQQLTPQRLHYFELPLSLTWRVHGAHQVFGGVGFNFLLGVDSKLNTREANSFESVNGRDQQTKAYIQGFNQAEPFGLIGYSYSWNGKLKVLLQAHYGLQDMLDDSYFKLNKQERNFYIKAGVGFRLF